ncbi:MAG: iron chelate uptake ABC transporter family permease subunit [Deinococcus sp.]|nr:iron chelate uptake ABC transporter family permease subunit [Deinococcus sp.]
MGYYLRQQRWATLLGGLVVLGLAAVLSTAVGSVPIPPGAIWRLLVGQLFPGGIPGDFPRSWAPILLQVRLPRVALAGVVGAALAVAGASYQGLFRNPLADPYLLGVAGGASVGASLALAFGLTLPFGLGATQVLAFAGALGAALAVYLLARVGRSAPVVTLLLAGVALGSLLTAVTSLILILSEDRAQIILAWLLGSFGTASWERVGTALPYMVPAALALLVSARLLNALQLGDEGALHLGIEIERLKFWLMVATTLLVAAAVSVSGLIGFVGLLIPHAVRLLWGPDYRFLLPMSALAGAIFLMAADTAARTLFPQAELPVGVVTAFCGAPFFLYLLRQRRKELGA